MFFCGHWGIKQVGSEARVGFPEEDLEEGEDSEEPTNPIQRGEHEEVLGFPDTLLTFERVVPLVLGVWLLGFLKRYHPRHHGKLILNHNDVGIGSQT